MRDTYLLEVALSESDTTLVNLFTSRKWINTMLLPFGNIWRSKENFRIFWRLRIVDTSCNRKQSYPCPGTGNKTFNHCVYALICALIGNFMVRWCALIVVEKNNLCGETWTSHSTTQHLHSRGSGPKNEVIIICGRRTGSCHLYIHNFIIYKNSVDYIFFWENLLFRKNIKLLFEGTFNFLHFCNTNLQFSLVVGEIFEKSYYFGKKPCLAFF